LVNKVEAKGISGSFSMAQNKVKKEKSATKLSFDDIIPQ
jgi:hypothetical protein